MNAADIWSLIQRHLPRNEWVPIQDIYRLIEGHAAFDDGDLTPAAPGSREPRWRRNVRNVLQQKKHRELRWDGQGCYQIPRPAPPVPPIPLPPAKGRTILQCADWVLLLLGRPAHVREIYDTIVRHNLYKFGARDPVGVVASKIRQEIRTHGIHARHFKAAPNTFGLVVAAQVAPAVQTVGLQLTEPPVRRNRPPSRRVRTFTPHKVDYRKERPLPPRERWRSSDAGTACGKVYIVIVSNNDHPQTTGVYERTSTR